MDPQNIYDFVVIGGGASGFFGAINLARRGFSVIILEKFQKVLSKLAISGGGRCNVTHHQFDPQKLKDNYPRGQKALLGPFHKFGPLQMIEWLKSAGVELKVELDGRMFPITNSSSTIIECFTKEAQKSGVIIEKGIDAEQILISDPYVEVITNKGSFFGKNLLIATGSNKHMWEILEKLGHTVIKPVPSLFALNTPHSIFNEISGISLKEATLKFGKHSFKGPLLFTHFGLSGPTALKLSSFAALEFEKAGYKASLLLDMLPDISEKDLLDYFMHEKQTLNQIHCGLPKRLWELVISSLKLDRYKPLSHIPKIEKQKLVDALKKSEILMEGKTTHKDEFVTAGGVDLNEVYFSNMQSKLFDKLYFAGEVLNIDGITGGFNFQSAWSTSFLVASDKSPS
jgi:predicted Rossmann fold flavoprotein